MTALACAPWCVIDQHQHDEDLTAGPDETWGATYHRSKVVDDWTPGEHSTEPRPDELTVSLEQWVYQDHDKPAENETGDVLVVIEGRLPGDQETAFLPADARRLGLALLAAADVAEDDASGDTALFRAYKILAARGASLSAAGAVSGIDCEDGGGDIGPVEDIEEHVVEQLAAVARARGLLADEEYGEDFVAVGVVVTEPAPTTAPSSATRPKPPPPTTECPSWCTHEGVHEFDEWVYDYDGDTPIFMRLHEARIGPFTVAGVELTAAPGVIHQTTVGLDDTHVSFSIEDLQSLSDDAAAVAVWAQEVNR